MLSLKLETVADSRRMDIVLMMMMMMMMMIIIILILENK